MIGRLARALKYRGLRALDLYKGAADYRWTFFDDGRAVEVAMRRAGGPERVMTLRAGTSDLHVFTQVFQSVQYSTARMARDSDLRARYDAIVAAGRRPLIVDAGANIGLAAIYYRDVYPQAAIVCVEPEPGNFAEARRHTAHDPLVLALHAALAGAEGAVEIVDPGRDSWGFQTRSAAAGAAAIPAHTVGRLIELAAERWPVEPFILKIDIEGYESAVFDGPVDWLDRFYLLIVELHDWMMPKERSAAGFLRAVAARDRDFVLKGENVFSIDNRDPTAV